MSSLLVAAVLGARVTAVLGLTALLLLALRRASAATRHLVAVAGLVGALALPFLAGTLPHLDLAVLPAQPRKWIDPSPGPAAAPREVAVAPSAPAAPEPASAREQSSLGLTLARALGGLTFLAVGWAKAAWATVALLLLARLAAGLLWLSRLERGASKVEWDAQAAGCSEAIGLRRPVRLLRSAGVDVPMTAGVLEPMVILPDSSRGWSAERRRLVLLHELAHVKRLDWLSVVACEVATAFWWLHPLAWWVLRAAHIEAEKATDDLVVRAGARPSVYAGHLVEMVRALRGGRAVAGAMPMARASDLEARLRALLDGRGRGPASSRGRALAVALAASAALLAVVRPIAPAEAAVPAEDSAWRHARAAEATQASKATEPPEATEPSKATQPSEVTQSSEATRPSETTQPSRTWSAEPRRTRRAPAALPSGAGPATGAEPAPEPAAVEVAPAVLPEPDLVAARQEANGEAWREPGLLVVKKDEVVKLDERGLLVAKKEGKEERKHGRWGHQPSDGARSLEALLAHPPASPDPFYQVAKELFRDEDWDGAARAFREAAQRSTRPGKSYYNMACALAQKGASGEALDALQTAIETGFDNPGLVRTDPDLRSLHGQARFEALVDDAGALELPGVTSGGEVHPWWKKAKFERECREAAERLGAYLAAHPRSGRAAYGVGLARLGLGELEASARAFRLALELGFRPSTTLYNLACVEARRERLDDAFRYLDQSIDAGFDEPSLIRKDEDLDNLRGDPRYRAAIRKADERERAAKDAE